MNKTHSRYFSLSLARSGGSAPWRPLSVGAEPSLSFYAGFYVATGMYPAGWGQPENPGGINTVRPRFHRGLISDFRFCTRGAATSCSFVPPRCRTVKFQAVLGAPPPKLQLDGWRPTTTLLAADGSLLSRSPGAHSDLALVGFPVLRRLPRLYFI